MSTAVWEWGALAINWNVKNHLIVCKQKGLLLFVTRSSNDIKLSCDIRFQRAFTACSCIFKVIALVWANQRNFFENATTCSKRMRKTLVATQLITCEVLKVLVSGTRFEGSILFLGENWEAWKWQGSKLYSKVVRRNRKKLQDDFDFEACHFWFLKLLSISESCHLSCTQAVLERTFIVTSFKDEFWILLLLLHFLL